MFASSNYPPDQKAADEFVAKMRHGTLIAYPPEGHPQVSILPFVRGGGYIELHCVQGDPTFDAVRANPLVTFFVSDFLAWSPHDWVDPVDAGKATLHFRAVAFECQAEDVSTDPEAVAGALRRLLQAYEPDRTYDPPAMGEFYGPRLKRLATMRLRELRRHVKFKTGLGTPDMKERLVDHLRERDQPGDARAAAVIESYIEKT